MKKLLCAILILISAVAFAAENITARDLVGEWKCKAKYRDKKTDFVWYSAYDAVQYADQTAETHGIQAFAWNNVTLLYRFFEKGNWKLENNVISGYSYSYTLTREFTEEMEELIQENPEFKQWEQEFFNEMQENAAEHIKNKTVFNYRILNLDKEILRLEEIPDSQKGDVKPVIAICQRN